MNNNRRGWVKNAIIVFLAVMLVLTFFSNTIMNASLPEVAAQYARSGSITSKIRTNATVTANQKHKITIDESREILSVPVKEGDYVEVGDPLFYLVDAESSQLKSAREQLAALEKQYALKMLESGEDYYADELAISNKADELSKAREALSDVSSNSAKLESITAEIKSLSSEQKALAKQISAYANQIAKLKAEAAEESFEGIPTSERIAAAEIKYNEAKALYTAAEALKNQTAAALDLAEEAFERANESYEALDPDKSNTAESLSKQIAELSKTMRRAKEDYNLSVAKLDEQLEDAYDEWVDADFRYNSALSVGASQDTLDRYFEASENARLAYEALVETIQPQKASLKLSYDRQYEDNNERLTELEEALAGIAGTEKALTALEKATKAKTAAEKAAASASEDFEKQKANYTELESELRALEKLEMLESCEKIAEELDEKNEKLSETIAEKNDEKQEISGGAVDTETQQELIKNLEQDLATMRHNLAKRREEASLQDKREQLELDELVADIEEQKELVEKYEANSVDAKITATVAGQVTSISAVAGSETSVGQTMCEIVVTDLGYSCEINLSAEQAKRVRVGDEVTVSNNWWSSISASIVSLKNDPKNPGAQKIATIALNGDVTVGQSLSLTIGEKGQSYDAVVPNSAIREDNNGKFVLVVEAKSSPLGNRYIAQRVDIQVLASDDTSTAVSGLLGSEFVITTSSTPIAAGTQVRMSES